MCQLLATGPRYFNFSPHVISCSAWVFSRVYLGSFTGFKPLNVAFTTCCLGFLKNGNWVSAVPDSKGYKYSFFKGTERRFV